MATPTYTPIASITLGSSASSVTFSSIPQGYRDLVLVVNGSGTGNNFAYIYFNSDTGSNYSQVRMQGDGSSASSTTDANSGFLPINTSTRSQAIVQVMDYSATDKHKTFLIRDNESSTLTLARALRWANTAAITTLEVETNSGSFSSGSTFALYGIEA